jgi:hypothetical protein
VVLCATYIYGYVVIFGTQTNACLILQLNLFVATICGNECARTTRYDANDFTSRAAFYRWMMDCSCGCIPGNCPSCFACLAYCQCHLDRPTLDALEAEWREELSAAAAERQSAESETSPQPAEKSKAKGRRDRMTALVRQRRDTAIARIARAESKQEESEKQGQAVKRQRGGTCA